MGDMEHKTAKRLIIILTFIILLGVITSLFSFQSNALKTKPVIGANGSGSSNGSIVNNSQNTTNATKNIISIPLEKPPFIKD
jgi:hypothetical protein